MHLTAHKNKRDSITVKYSNRQIMGGGGDRKDSGSPVKDALLLNVLSEYDAIPGNRLVECTVMAQIKAEQGNEERRAPVTICAAIDRR